MAMEEVVQIVDQSTSEAIFDVEEYSLDIVNHMKRAEVSIHHFSKFPLADLILF